MIQTDFITGFKRAIEDQDYQGLLLLYKKYPYIMPNIRIQGNNPLFWVFGEYIQHVNQELTRNQIEIIKKVIEYTSTQDMNEIDEEGDDILSHVFYLSDDHDAYLSILKKLVQHGYSFNKHTQENDFTLYLASCHQQSIPINKRIVELILKHTSSDILNQYLDQIMNEVVLLSFEDMEHIVHQLQKKGVHFPTNHLVVATLFLSHEFRNASISTQKRKVKLLISLDYKLPPNALSLICEMHNPSFSLFTLVMKHMEKPISQGQLDHAFDTLAYSHPYWISPEKIKIAKQLLDMGAKITKRILQSTENKNTEWINLVYSSMPTTNLKRLRPSSELQKQLRKQHMSFRTAMQDAESITRAQQRNLRPVKSKTEAARAIAGLHRQLRQQLWSLMSTKRPR